MTLNQYTVRVKREEYWQEIHDTLCGISSCEHIPDREVCCTDEKEHSPTRGTFSLYEHEVDELRNHPHIDWVEPCPSCYPELYPKPQPATKRFKENVKIYRDLDLNGPPASNPTIAENKRTNWAVKRVGIQTNGDHWAGVTTNPPVTNGDISYSLTGKNVDIVIQDSGILQYHPEFLDENGQSRVRDIVLDGPYYIDAEYFNNIIPGVKYTKADGRVGIATTSAEEWWENGAKRSASFSGIGTIAIPASYTANNAMGIGGTVNNMIDGHGTACAGLAAGKYMGLAFEANIWNMPGIADNTGMTVELNYDLIKLFHKHKPINSETGKKNPTVVNGSWGYQAAFGSGDTVGYKFRGETGTFLGNSVTSNQVTAMKNGLVNQVTGAYRSWSTSSRSSSTNTAGDEMMAEGVIYVAAAGNNNQRLGIGSNDPDRLNYMEDEWFGLGDSRPEFGGLNCPCNHRDWMNPQGIGFDSSKDFHPVICVGAMDEYINTDLSERKASYSNNGPGIDVWAPADETLAPGTNRIASYEDYRRYDDSRFFDCYFNGTSAAAPVVTGLIALYLESNPTATSKDVKEWLKTSGSIVVESSLYQDQYTDDTQTSYWTGTYNMRGAERRIVYDRSANDTDMEMSTNVTITIKEQIETDGLVLHLDSWNTDSYSGSGSTWTDLSGNGNNAELRFSYGYSDKSITFADSGYANIPDTSDFDFSGDFSLESWFYLTNTPNPTFPSPIFASWQSAFTDNDKIILFINSSLQIALQMNTGTNTLIYPSTISLNQWYHIVVSRINGVVNIYLNGVVGNSLNYSSAISPVLDMRIGGYQIIGILDPLPQTFEGKIPVARIYKDRGLTSKEVMQHYVTQKGRFFGQSNMIISRN